jgi:hypothetical protein
MNSVKETVSKIPSMYILLPLFSPTTPSSQQHLPTTLRNDQIAAAKKLCSCSRSCRCISLYITNSTVFVHVYINIYHNMTGCVPCHVDNFSFLCCVLCAVCCVLCAVCCVLCAVCCAVCCVLCTVCLCSALRALGGLLCALCCLNSS